MNEQDIIDYVEGLVASINSRNILPEPLKIHEIEFFDTTTTAGWAQRTRDGRNILKFHRVLAKNNPNTYHETIIHEVAHIATRIKYPKAKQHHGPEFKYMNSILGGRDGIRHSYSVVGLKRKMLKYIYTCNCNMFMLSPVKHRKVQDKTARYSCHKCKGILVHNGRTIKE